MEFAKEAEQLALGLSKHYRCRPADSLRDDCDIHTGGELDCTQLDIFFDMVKAKLRERNVSVCEECACQGMRVPGY